MSENRIRGFVPDDDIVFGSKNIPKLKTAQREIKFLLDCGYPMKSTVTFVSNHHQLTVRQSIALTRATSSSENIRQRERKRLSVDEVRGKTVYIDGFNLVIAIEVALSNGMLFRGMDGCIRDLAELRGTYRLIPQTNIAIDIIENALCELGVESVVIYLDQPVSNSGRLKAAMYETEWRVPLDVEIVRNPDMLLKELSCVVTGDAIILNECESWLNLVEYILKKNVEFKNLSRFVDLSKN